MKEAVSKTRRIIAGPTAMLFVSLCILLPIAQVSVAQWVQVVPPASSDVPETYRLRIENALYGRVEVSFDTGKSWTLLGRVTKPATFAVQDKTALQPGVVLRGSTEGFAFSANPGFALKVRPAPGKTSVKSSVASAVAEITTSLNAEKGLFGKYLPPPGSRVLFQAPTHSPIPFPDGYSTSQTDTFVVTAALSTPPPTPGTQSQSDAERTTAFRHALRALFESIGAEYRDGSMLRANTDKRKIVAGTLTLRPNLPPDEPDPISAITYAIDDFDNVVCARTTAPYLFGWDTTTVSDGEHVIEIRGLSANGSVVTKTRYLVVINNHKATQ